MSRGTKSKAVSREKGSPPQVEARSGDMKIADRFRMLSERADSRFVTQDKKHEALQEDIKNKNQRLEELQLWVPRPRLADMGIQEGTSGELEGIAIEAGKRRITPPDQQRQ